MRRVDVQVAKLEHGLLLPKTRPTKPDCAINNHGYDITMDKHIKFY